MESLYKNDSINIYLINNKLNIHFLEEAMTEEIFENIKKYITLFLNICNKKNTQFYFVYNFTKISIKNYTNILSYAKTGGDFLNSIKNILDKHLIGTIIITENSIAESLFNLVLTFYTPVKPIKFFKSNEIIDYNFN